MHQKCYDDLKETHPHNIFDIAKGHENILYSR